MTKPQRYGASAAPRDDGIFCLYAEYEKVVAERDALRAENDSLMSALADCREAAFSKADNPWLVGAVGDPLDVPGYVKWELDRLRATDKEKA